MKRKPNRLNLENYRTPNTYYLTLNCHNRESHFVHKNLVDVCIVGLRKLVGRFNAKLWAYCFMPDHLHLLCESDKCLDIIKLFKQISGYSFKMETGRNLWQKSFYDHILRSEENLIGVIKYIFNNPVRGGLVTSYLDYPYSGSLEFDIRSFVEG